MCCPLLLLVHGVLEVEIKRLKEEPRGAGTGSAGGGSYAGSVTSGGGNVFSSYAAAAASAAAGPSAWLKTPKNERRTIVVGGFPQDSSRESITAAATTLTAGVVGLEDFYPVGKRPQIFKMLFKSSKFMWGWLKRMKGQRLEWQALRLWHTVEKDQDERLLSKKVSFLLEN